MSQSAFSVERLMTSLKELTTISEFAQKMQPDVESFPKRAVDLPRKTLSQFLENPEFLR